MARVTRTYQYIYLNGVEGDKSKPAIASVPNGQTFFEHLSNLAKNANPDMQNVTFKSVIIQFKVNDSVWRDINPLSGNDMHIQSARRLSIFSYTIKEHAGAYIFEPTLLDLGVILIGLNRPTVSIGYINPLYFSIKGVINITGDVGGELQTKYNGIIKKTKSVVARHSGVFKDAKSIYTKHNGVIKETK